MTPTAALRSGVLVFVVAAILLGAFLLLRGEPTMAPGDAFKDKESSAVNAADASGSAADRRDDSKTERVALADAKVAEAPMVRATGRLIDARGGPVAEQGLQLEVPAEPPKDKEKDKDRERQQPNNRPKWQTASETVSEADGTFALSLPVGTLARLTTAGEQRVFRRGVIAIEPRTVDLDLGELVVQQACEIAGVARDQHGAACQGVTVLCNPETRWPDDSRATKVETGADGSFRFAGLANGPWRLQCRSPRHVQQQRSVELQPEQRLLDVVFVLDDGGAISGRVVDDAAAPVAEAEVMAWPTQNEGMVRIKTAADGTFTLGGLTAPAYNIIVRCKNHRSDNNPTPANAGDHDLTLILPRAAVIAGTVVDEAGQPVVGSRVQAVRASQPVDEDKQWLAWNRGEPTDAEGHFALQDLGTGDYRLLARGPHLDASSPTLHAQTGQPLETVRFVVQRGGVARITVRDPTGAPVAHARLRIADPETKDIGTAALLAATTSWEVQQYDARHRIVRTETDDAGVAVIGGLQPVTYKVQVAQKELVQPQSATFQVPEHGDVALTIELVAGGFAAVEVAGADGVKLPKRRILIEGPLAQTEPQQQRVETGSDGTVRVGPLVTGRYAAMLGRHKKADALSDVTSWLDQQDGPPLLRSRVEFSVAAGATTAVVLHRPESITLHGTLSDARGPLANGTVQLGAASPDRALGERYGFDGSLRSARSNPDGSFTLTEIEPGDYRIRFGKSKQQLLAERQVTLAGGADAQLDLFVQCGNVRVAVRNAGDHEPIAEAQATLQRAEDVRAPGAADVADFAFQEVLSHELTTDARGVCEFTEVPFGRYVVAVSAAHHSSGKSAVITLGSAVADAGAVELTAAARITGALLDPLAAEPRPWSCVEYRRSDEKEFTQTWGQNRYETGNLTAGDYLLRVRRIGNNGFADPGPERPVHVGDGEVVTVDLRVPLQ
jgi:hypothetical protein